MLMKVAAACALLLLLLGAVGLSAGCAPTALTAFLGATPALPPCSKLPARAPRCAVRRSIPSSRWNQYTCHLCQSFHENQCGRFDENLMGKTIKGEKQIPRDQLNISALTDWSHKSKADVRATEGVYCRRSGSKQTASTVSNKSTDSTCRPSISNGGCKCPPFARRNDGKCSARLSMRRSAVQSKKRENPFPDACDLDSFCNVLKKMRGCSLRCLPHFLCRRGGGDGDGGGAGSRDGGGGGQGVYEEHARGRRRRSDVAGAILTLALAGIVALVAVAVLAALLTAAITAALVVAVWDGQHRPTLHVAPHRPSSTL